MTIKEQLTDLNDGATIIYVNGKAGYLYCQGHSVWKLRSFVTGETIVTFKRDNIDAIYNTNILLRK